jgi:hypothetical protein
MTLPALWGCRWIALGNRCSATLKVIMRLDELDCRADAIAVEWGFEVVVLGALDGLRYNTREGLLSRLMRHLAQRLH